MFSESIQKLIEKFSKFPTVGPRTASRFVFYLLRAQTEEVKDLVNSIIQLKQSVKVCNFCFGSFESDNSQASLCLICRNPQRSGKLLCVIENEIDLEALEKINAYKGLYFVLGATVSKLRPEDLAKLRIKELTERVKNPQKFGLAGADFTEIVLALNPTIQGEATSRYLKRSLAPLGKKISQLGRGLPIGSEMEYADQETLFSALKNRR